MLYFIFFRGAVIYSNLTYLSCSGVLVIEQHMYIYNYMSSSWYQDGNTSPCEITKVKHHERNQFSDGQNLLISGNCWSKKVGTMAVTF